MSEEFWSNMNKIWEVYYVIFNWTLCRFVWFNALLLHPIFFHHFGLIKQTMFFWAFNLIFICPIFAMYLLGFITIVFYFIYYPKSIIYSKDESGYFGVEHLFGQLLGLCWSVPILLPSLSYILFDSLLMPSIFYAVIFLSVLANPFEQIWLKMFCCTFSCVLTLLALYLYSYP